MATITITDETTGSKTKHSFTLEFLDETVTARELIRRRIYQEVQDHNLNKNDHYQGLVQPTQKEQSLNAPKTPRHINWEEQYARATEAFERHGFVMLVNDQQIEDLNENVALREGTTITFLKLVPLVGG